MSLSPTRVVVTGGSGFVGSHLCESLIEMGHEVLCIDNLLTGATANIEHLRNNPRFQFEKHDVTRHIDVDGPVGAVMHFASPASPIDYLEMPIPTMKVGSLGTHNALGLAKAKGARFLLASTSEIYGDPLVHPQPETYWGNVNPIGPRSVYDEAKRFAEAITMAYQRFHNLDTRIVRIFNTYGPRMRPNDGRVVSNFIIQALSGKPITVYGKGEQTRSFCFVTDLVRGILSLLTIDRSKETATPFNIGNPEERTVMDLAKKIIAMTKSDSSIVTLPLPVDDPQVRRPDTHRCESILGWKPKVGIDEGLERTISYFSKVVQA